MKRLIFLLGSLMMFSSCFLFPTGNDDADEEKLHLLWEYSYNNPEGHEPIISPLIIDNRFIITSGDNSVTSHNILDGSLNWKSETYYNTSLRNTAFALNNGIIAGTISKEIKAWNVDTGEQMWSIKAPDSLKWNSRELEIASTHNGFIIPSRSDYLYFISNDGVPDVLPLDVFALNAITADNTIYALQRKSGKPAFASAYDMASLDLKWRYDQNDFGYYESNPPVFNEEMLYLFFEMPPLGNSGNGVIALNTENGAEIWRKTDVFVDAVVINEDVIYGRSGFSVWALNKHTGRLLWKIRQWRYGLGVYSIEYLDGYIYAPHSKGIMILNAESGENVAFIKKDIEGSYHFVKAGAGRIFVQSTHKLHVFAPWGHTEPLEGY